MTKQWRDYRLLVLGEQQFRWMCTFHEPSEQFSRAYAESGDEWSPDTLLVRPEVRPHRVLRVTWTACDGPIIKPGFVRACIEESLSLGWLAEHAELMLDGALVSQREADEETMTESDWLNCDQPPTMIRHLRQIENFDPRSSWFGSEASGWLPRKWRLFLAACCRRVELMLGTPHSRSSQLIEIVQRYTDQCPGEKERQQLDTFFGQGRSTIQYTRFLRGLTSPLGRASGELRNIAGHRARHLTEESTEKDAAQRGALDDEARAQCALIRDIFGNPFRSVRFDPAWKNAAVLGLAEEMYELQEFGPISILGDALQDVGCSEKDIVEHCLEPGPHVRGCWVVDLVLEKS